MSPTGSEIVIDASALVRGVVVGEPQAVEWVERIALRDVQGIAPDHVYVEVANSLRGYLRARWIEADAADERISAVLDLPLTTFPSRLLARQALGLTQTRGVSAYDGLYLALALGFGARLVTADRRLATAAGDAAVLLPPV